MAKSIYALLGAALAVSLVAGPARAYDFQARNASLSTSSSAPFVRYTFEAEVVNRGGDSTLVGPTVEFEYRKSGGVWTEFYSRILPKMNRGVRRTFSSEHSQPVAGTYRYRACVTSVPDDTDVENNCSSTVTIGIGSVLD